MLGRISSSCIFYVSNDVIVSRHNSQMTKSSCERIDLKKHRSFSVCLLLCALRASNREKETEKQHKHLISITKQNTEPQHNIQNDKTVVTFECARSEHALSPAKNECRIDLNFHGEKDLDIFK